MSGARVAVQMHHRCSFGDAARVFAIVFGLLLTEGVAFGQVARRRFNTAQAAPAEAVFGGERTHLILGVMDPAAVAKHRFSHHNLIAKGTGQSRKNDMPVLQFNDTYFYRWFNLITAWVVAFLSLN